MKIYFIFLLLAGCANTPVVQGIKESPVLEIKCTQVQEVRYDAFYERCKESPCIRCTDTTHN